MSDRTMAACTPLVAIGGLGGSGTRVFAALMQSAGVDIGQCLNQALDNLWFTVLFKRPEWTRLPAAQFPASEDVATAVRLFHRAMVSGLADWTNAPDQQLLQKLKSCLPPQGNWQSGACADHAGSLITSLPPTDGALRVWGWKEPNTHVFLPHLNRHFPALRYIHIVRNGLDMAFSGSSWQVRHWGQLYDMPYRPELPLPQQQLRYWSAANKKVIAYGATHMQGRFLTVHYEDFCDRPQAQWVRIQKFLGLSGEEPLPSGLVRPTTIGRSSARDLSVFSQLDLADAQGVQNLVESEGNVSC
ncbi:sulfotransferase [Pseudotabrizicola sp. 4114]|uniref:sulfotransferase family protein n=1 Tax=Pseudotabrizicola sp. 4114 TaxID=2817731 RepID=UPI0032B78B0C